jgi:L-alanine-DL-glutamate epimerase-like enolase superfamily enzyme
VKLADWSLHCYRLPYFREVVWANAIESSGTYALLQLVADNGVQGIAEGTLKDTWTGFSPGSLFAVLRDIFIPRIKNLDLENETSVERALSGIPENRLPKGMIETACWTMRAAAAGKPLWKLWGGERSVEVTFTVTRQKPALMAAESAEVCARHGFRHLKVKGGQGVAVDLQALKEIRTAVGPGVALAVDANSEYPREEAAAYVRAIAGAGAVLAEDPSRLAPDEAFAKLQAESPIPILVDRTCASREDAALYLERGAKALSTKPGRVGLTETRAIAALAAARGAKTAVGIYAESLLGTLINLQQPGTMAAEQTFFLGMKEQVTDFTLPIRNGRIELPDGPDLSQYVNWEKVKTFSL